MLKSQKNNPFTSFNYKLLMLSMCTFLLLQSCYTKKVINKENGEALPAIIVNKTNTNSIYRATPDIQAKVLQTELFIAFDFEKHYLIGKEILIVSPLPYKNLDSLVLDAKSMEISTINVDNIPVNFKYKNNKLSFKIPPHENSDDANLPFVITIQYIAKPDDKEMGGSAAIRGDKGLYFINTNKLDSLKPTQVWTQGETESNSGWFPCIDKPNCKSKFIFHIQVPENFYALSNGFLQKSEKNEGKNLRTDTWVQDLPMSNYLAMMAIGEYAKFSEKWNNKNLEYFVEKKYAKEAKNNFARTPEMLTFFGQKLGVQFPWAKYSQVTARDYVSGAMENTSASLFGEFVQKQHAELVDVNNDGIVAHEMFHQWFGDLVTCESWSNLVLNEGFATYGEYLWYEHYYGKEQADRLGYSDLQRYLGYAKSVADHPIVRFYYPDKETMFSPITYKKGGRVLHQLRNVLGDEIFFKSLQKYLQTYSFQTAEVHDLRKVFEEVSGKDLNTYFTQYFYKGGHPKLEVNYRVEKNNLIVRYEQKNDSSIVYNFPISWKLINASKQSKKMQTTVEVKSKLDSLTIDLTNLQLQEGETPCIYVDAAHTFVGEIIENISLENKQKNYANADNYVDEIKNVSAFAEGDTIGFVNSTTAFLALQDTESHIRNYALQQIDLNKKWDKEKLQEICKIIAIKDELPGNRSLAFDILSKTKYKNLRSLAIQQLTADSSARTLASALYALQIVDSIEAYKMAKQMENKAVGVTLQAIGFILQKNNIVSDTAFYIKHIPASFGNERIALLEQLTNFALAKDAVMPNAIQQLLYYAKNDERESIKIAGIKQLKKLNEKLTATTNFTTLLQEIKNNLPNQIQFILVNEKNSKAIAEYKRLGFLPK